MTLPLEKPCEFCNDPAAKKIVVRCGHCKKNQRGWFCEECKQTVKNFKWWANGEDEWSGRSYVLAPLVPKC